MTPRGRFIAYLTTLHVMFAALALALLARGAYWLFAVEIVFAVSLVTGIVLTRGLFRNLGIAGTGLRLVQEQEFTSRIREVGQPEVDQLITVYNRMIDRLRDERTQLQEQHQFLSQILRVSPSGVVILDLDQRIAEVNPAAERLLDQPAGELQGTRLADARSPLGAALAALAAGDAQVIGLSGAQRVKCHHGTFVDRGFRRSFHLVEELTDELRQVERAAYEKLIRLMAHEVNNSVTASNSLLHSCLAAGREPRTSVEIEEGVGLVIGRQEPGTSVEIERAVGLVIERTEQLNRFMRRFADVFRLPPPVKQVCDMREMLEGIVRLIQARPEAAGIAWFWDVDEHTAPVSMDRDQMDQVFLNVLTNAVEAIEGTGEITIRLVSGNGSPTVTIEDTGAGLTAEAQANLFTPFFSTKPHGQGIGLTLVQEVLSAHGFQYSLESTPDGPTRMTIICAESHP